MPEKNQETPPVLKPAPLFIVGIGASAGGLESLERFFRSLPSKPGVAFVLAQHLSPNHESIMEELLQRFCPLPVRRAEQAMAVEANSVYVLPPGKELELVDDRLLVTDRLASRPLSFPVDRLFASLASNSGRHAVAIVLSGSGSDGSRGIRRVHEEGGLVLVEDPDGAAFDGMPRAALDTGVVDAALAPHELASLLTEYVASGQLATEDGTRSIDEVLELLKSHRGVELGDYKTGTIYRRLMRRVDGIADGDIGRYLERLRRDGAELEALHDDLFIGVTSFFRDPAVFAAAEQQLAQLAASPIEPDRPLRVWVAGCASGEEAYSFAILCEELLGREGSRRGFKIFATDAHKKTLARAASGVFRPEQLANVCAERLERHFVPAADGFKVRDELRHNVVFAQHDVLVDTPFTNLDLVSCRNLLIYFRPHAQRHALANLSYGIRLGGLLVLGPSESPGDFAQSFETLDEAGKIYRKKHHVQAMRRATALPRRAGVKGPELLARPDRGILATYDALLDRFMPTAFLISDQRRVLGSYGGADRLLQVPRHRPSLDFLELLPASARAAVAGVISRAQRQAGPSRVAQVVIRDGDEDRRFTAAAERLTIEGAEPALLVTLVPSEVPASAPTAQETAPAESGAHVLDLERELDHARRSLQTTVEELEASNEELQATNEELQASNEELQSVNEELHSVNEELHTVNAEHQHKIAELTELNRDVGHLLESIDVAAIFLDDQLRIRKFTPRAHGIFGLVDHDIGRLLTTFNHPLDYPTFGDDLGRVHREAGRVEVEVRDRDDHWYLVRILPYRTGRDVSGVVVTLTDATALARERGRARQLSAIVDSSADAIIGQTTDGVITSWNAGAARLYGYTAEEMIGESIMRLVPEEEREGLSSLLADIKRGSDLINVSTCRVTKTGGTVEIAKTVSPVRDREGRVVGIATIDRDIRVQKDTERRLRESERRFADLYNNAPDLYLTVDARSGLVVESNDTFHEVVGRERVQGATVHVEELFTPETVAEMRECLQEVREGRPINDRPLALLRADDGGLDVALSASGVYDSAGHVVRIRMVLRDVTRSRQAQRELQQAAAMRERFLAMASHELRGPLHAINTALQILDASAATADQREKCQAVLRRQTRQMVRLVDDLLDVSRISHGKLVLERSPVDLPTVLRNALDAVAAAFHHKGVRLVSEGLDRPIGLYGDGGRLEQVFSNLLENALRATESGRRVRVQVHSVDHSVLVEVVDEGRGIAPDHLRSIFGMFTQSAQGLDRTEGGLGLGLTIAEGIVLAHGGTIGAASDGLGKGSTFTVSLPVDRSIEVSERETEKGPQRLLVAVVEDQEDAREMIVAALTLQGHRPISAADGEAGTRLIVEQAPAIAFVDIGLPGKNGYEVAASVREQLGSGIGLIALSGYGQPEDIRKAEAAGFDRHITKPVEPGRLLETMRQVLERTELDQSRPQLARPRA